MTQERTPVSPEAPEGFVSVIEVEKLLLSKLGRQWTPSGISITSLVEELAAAREAGRREGLEEAAPVIAALATAIWQMLDDMGPHDLCVCKAAKAQARAAIDLVASPELEVDYTMEQARACFKDIGGEPLLVLDPTEFKEPWAAAIRRRLEGK